MPNFTDMTGLMGVASAIAASVQLLPGVVRFAKPRLGLLMGMVFVFMLIPFAGMPLATYVRGVTGDLSITALMLIACALLKPWYDPIKFNERNALLILVVLSALLLYPMALGTGMFDPYRLGYGNPQFVVALQLLALIAWFGKRMLLALCVALATLAWVFGWYESTNLWDYLLDPFVAVYALAALLTQVMKYLLQRLKSHSAYRS